MNGQESFVVLPPCGSKETISSMAQKNGVTYTQGRGYYTVAKREKISKNKEMVLHHIVTDTFTIGHKRCCELLGWQNGVDLSKTPEDVEVGYRLFVQSTSANRAIPPGNHILVAVPAEEAHRLKADKATSSTNNPGQLWLAASNGDSRRVKLLLDGGADVNQPGVNGETPLHTAAMDGHTECVRLLLENGADVDKPCDNDTAPLFNAAENGHADCVKLLLEHKADWSKQYTDYAKTPLCAAAGQRHFECMKLLLDYGADVNQQSEDDDGTALHEIFREGCEDDDVPCVELLLENGADPNIENDDGESAFFTAEDWGGACFEFLRTWVKKRKRSSAAQKRTKKARAA